MTKVIINTISYTLNAVFILAIILAFRTGLITIDQPQVAMNDDQYAMIIGQAGKEAKQSTFAAYDAQQRHK